MLRVCTLPADEPYSVFVCGPQAMYRFVDAEVEKLGLERKYVRQENRRKDLRARGRS